MPASSGEYTWVHAPMPPAMRRRLEEWTRLRNAVYVTYVDTAEVYVLGNLGYIHARAAFTMADASGKQTKGKTDYLDIYEKRNGRWVAVAAHVLYLGDQP